MEHFEDISERGPEYFKAAIEDVFKRVAIPFVRVHPGSFFSIINNSSAVETRVLASVPRVSSHLNCMSRSKKRRKM